MEIGYKATDDVRRVIESFGRTEDIRFSPSNRRLVIAAAVRNTLAVLEVDIAASANRRDVSLTGAFEISSPSFRYPHGLDFIDEETLMVGSRGGDVGIYKLPPTGTAGGSHELPPIQTVRAGRDLPLHAPGSICVASKQDGPLELLVCNNYRNNVTRHVLDRGSNWSISAGEVLLRKWLDIPDGISVSKDGRWIAVSNHNTHRVLLYENSPSLNPNADPDGVLRSIYYPHGLRFSADGRYLFVADAGAPYVYVYASDGQSWHGVRNPIASLKVMDQSVFSRGRDNPHEGGPKGIDVDLGLNVLVTTSEHQPLAFFDLPPIFEAAPAVSEPIEMEYELHILEQHRLLGKRVRQAKANAKNRASFGIGRTLRRIAHPLRRILPRFGG